MKHGSILESKRLLSDIYNFEEQGVPTPKAAGFGSALKGGLTNDENNLARIKFVHREAMEKSPRIECEGRPKDRYQVRSPILTSQPPVSRRAEWDDHHFDAETYWPGAGKLESSSTLPPAPGRS
jgi:hypothetical protein